MKLYFLIALFFLGGLIAYSQNRTEIPVFSPGDASIRPYSASTNLVNKYSELDNRAMAFDISAKMTIGELASLLTVELNDEIEKVRSIYSWIATHISYDSMAFFSGKVPDQNPVATLNRRSAVCEGYAKLFVALCKQANVESRMVKGYVRESNVNYEYPNHVWNSVMINGKWRLLDVTWAALYFNEAAKNKSLLPVQELNAYFLVAPENLIFTHLPEDPYWQLIPRMVSLSDFIAGEKVLCTTVAKSSQETLDFERIIAEDDRLDSLDREIAFLRRIVSQDMSGSRDYALAIAFYYKAQRLVDQAGTTTGETAAEYLALAKSYYQKTIECLNLVRENHSDYRFSRDFAINVTHRLSQLQ